MRRIHRYALASAVLLLAGVCAYVALNSRRNTGVVMPAPERPVYNSPDYEEFEGKYITFTHKGTYNSQTLEAKGADLELYMLRAGTNYEKRLAVAVSELPGGILEANSGYNMRKTATTTYTMREMKVADATASIWTKNNGEEVTVFIPRGQMVVVLSFVAMGANEQLGPEVDELLRSFAWK